MTPNQVLAAYKMFRSSRKAGDALKIDYREVLRVVKEIAPNLLVPRGGRYGKIKVKLHGSFALWLKSNPGIELPKDLDAIAKMSSCSKDSIKCFFYRQRKKGKAIPLLRKRRVKNAEG